MLRDLMRPPPGMHAAIVSRVKVIGKMDIAEKRLPQEGRVRIVAEGREIDLRVSSMPTLLGEKLVVRVLDKSNLHVEMDQLGLRDEALTAWSSGAPPAARDGARHGADGQRQDDDALLGARPAPQRRSATS
jgi:type II secretory ATPase GspE/PulE/Tfp pilus assembly ATPase PilB-like protein